MDVEQLDVEMTGQQSQLPGGVLGANVNIHGMSLVQDPSAYYAQLMMMGSRTIPTMPSPAATTSESSPPAMPMAVPGGNSGGMSQEQENLLREHIFLQRQLLLLQQQQQLRQQQQQQQQQPQQPQQQQQQQQVPLGQQNFDTNVLLNSAGHLPVHYLEQQKALSPLYLEHFNPQLAAPAPEESPEVSNDGPSQDGNGQQQQRTATNVAWPHSHHQPQHALQQVAANGAVLERNQNAPGAIVTGLATRVGSSRRAGSAGGPGSGLGADMDLLRLADLSIMHPPSEPVPCAPASKSIPTSDSTATITGPQPPSSAASPSPSPSHQYTQAQPQEQQQPHQSQSQSQPPSQTPNPHSQSHTHLHPHSQLQPPEFQLHTTSHPPIYAHSSSSCSDLPIKHPKPHHPQQQQALWALASSSALPDSSASTSRSPRKATAQAPSAVTASSPSKKIGRLESIYATIRKATNMRRSRVILQEAHAQPLTVSPMATLRDTGNTRTITRKHNPDHLDLSSLAASVAPLPMPTPPLTGTGSVSSVSSSLTSLSSSLMDGATTSLQSLQQQQQHQPFETSADNFAFVSGLADDPFVDSDTFFAAQQLQQQQQQQLLQQQMMPLGHYGKNILDTNAVASPATVMTVSPSAYLADATAAMSGTSVIAAAYAAQLAAASRRDAALAPALTIPSSEMDTEEDWWHQSVADPAVDENMAAPTVNGVDAAGEIASSAALNMALQMQKYDQQQQQQQQQYNYQQQGGYYQDFGLATGGLMIMQPSHEQNQNQNQNQYYFPGVHEGATGTTAMQQPQSLHGGYDVAVVPPPPPMPSDRETRYDRHRRPKPRAPSAGARHHHSLSPRKRVVSHENNGNNAGGSNSNSGSGSGSIPCTPRQTARRSHSMQALSRTSPTPAVAAATPSSAAVRKRRSVSNMRRTSSGGLGLGEPRTPSGARRQRSTSVEAQRPSSSSGGGGIGFVNFTPDDGMEIMTGVAPSGSSKTKARREREQAERTRKLSERLVKAATEAGVDIGQLEAAGLGLV